MVVCSISEADYKLMDTNDGVAIRYGKWFIGQEDQ